MTWRKEPERHAMASRGIKTKENKLVASGKKKQPKELVKFVGDQEIGDYIPKNFKFSSDPKEIKKLWGEKFTHIVKSATQKASNLEEFQPGCGYVEIWKGTLIGQTTGRKWHIESCNYEYEEYHYQERTYFSIEEIK